jgi:hypothetical protein
MSSETNVQTVVSQPIQTPSKEYEFPTEVISLPSEGKVYPLNHPLSKGTVTIKYMTAKEEDILSSQNLIKKGVVLDKLLESVVVDAPIDDLVIGDKNAIFLATRILGYGANYDVEVTDPFSGERQAITIDLSAVKTKDIDFSKLNRENIYEFKLPSNDKTVIKFKLLTHKDEVDITQEIQALERVTKGTNASDVTTRLRKMVLEVNGNKDRGFVNKWVQNNFLARDIKAFRAYVKELSPDLDLKFNFVSNVTGEMEALDIPFGINFFYPTT